MRLLFIAVPLAIWALLGSSVCQVAGDELAPKLRLEKGMAWTTTSKQEFREPGSPDIREGFTYRTRFVAAEIGQKGVTAESSTDLIQSQVDNTVIPGPKSAPPLLRSILLGPNGERASLSDPLADPIEFRLERLGWYVGPGGGKPVADDPGAWAVVLPADEGGRVPEAKATYRFERREKLRGRPTHRFEANFSERDVNFPFKALATFWVDDATGLVLECRVKATNVIMPGGDGERFDLAILETTELPVGKR